MSRLKTSIKVFTLLSLSLSTLSACASLKPQSEGDESKIGASETQDLRTNDGSTEQVKAEPAKPKLADKPQSTPHPMPLSQVNAPATTGAVTPGGYRQAEKKDQGRLQAGLMREELERRPTDNFQDVDQDFQTEDYDRIYENPFLATLKNPLSTFSIDVDSASYSNTRRFIEQQNQLPPADAVRIEELVNYFPYHYANPEGKHPFSVTTDLAECPWNSEHKLLRIGLKGKPVSIAETPPANLVFLLDVSGSMSNANKLPLLKRSLKLLVDKLREEDHVSIVVYAGAAGTVLPPTSGAKKEVILDALDRLQAGGSTAGSAGIKLAYETAQKNFRKDGNNRIILATDGDFNVGPSSDSELTRMIEDKRKQGIFLTVLGFGMGNYKDNKMEKLADKGNGNYAYIDNLLEARKVLVTEMGSTLLTIAKDVKLQLEFNPAKVKEYRLIGYENRLLAAEDFDDDSKDAGEMGAGTTVTALYELVPGNGNAQGHDLKYQQNSVKANAKDSDEIMTVKLRYKPPTEDKSILISQVVKDNAKPWRMVSEDFRFAASVASFGMNLRKSEHKGSWGLEDVVAQAQMGVGSDEEGYRLNFVKLAKQAQSFQHSD